MTSRVRRHPWLGAALREPPPLLFALAAVNLSYPSAETDRYSSRRGERLLAPSSMFLPVGMRWSIVWAATIPMSLAALIGWIASHQAYRNICANQQWAYVLGSLFTAIAFALTILLAFAILYVRWVLFPTRGCADAILHAAPPHRRGLLVRGCGLLLDDPTSRSRAGITTRAVCEALVRLICLPNRFREQRYPGLMALRLREDQSLQRVLFADSLARHALGGAHSRSRNRHVQLEDDRFGFASTIVRLYFGHFLLAILFSMILVPVGILWVKPEPRWFYDCCSTLLVLWWLMFVYSTVFSVKPEFEMLRNQRESTVEYLPTSAMHRQAMLTLSRVLEEAQSHVLPTILSVSGTLLLMAALTMLAVLATSVG